MKKFWRGNGKNLNSELILEILKKTVYKLLSKIYRKFKKFWNDFEEILGKF